MNHHHPNPIPNQTSDTCAFLIHLCWATHGTCPRFTSPLLLLTSLCRINTCLCINKIRAPTKPHHTLKVGVVPNKIHHAWVPTYTCQIISRSTPKPRSHPLHNYLLPVSLSLPLSSALTIRIFHHPIKWLNHGVLFSLRLIILSSRLPPYWCKLLRPAFPNLFK